ncbi:MAG TPA: hypothetical protein VN201_15025 [Roseateles sp.]|nr:hypothetical protein [Roseateles sp.]
MEELERELIAAADSSRRYARRNYLLGYSVAIATVLSSIVAGLTVSIATVPKEVTAALASMPAAMVAAGTVFRFDQKSAWFWQKAKRIEALLRAVRYEAMALPEASQQFSLLEVEMERNWIGFGAINRKSD